MFEFPEVPGRSARSPCRPEYTKFKAQVTKNVLLPSRLFECTRPVTPPPVRPGQVEPFLPPTRAIFQPLWGQNESGKERKMSFDISPPLEAAVPQNEIYHRRCWLALVARRCDFKARPTLARDIPLKSSGRSSRVLAFCSSSITLRISSTWHSSGI